LGVLSDCILSVANSTSVHRLICSNCSSLDRKLFRPHDPLGMCI
jgi:rRNA-processing protein FCF1